MHLPLGKDTPARCRAKTAAFGSEIEESHDVITGEDLEFPPRNANTKSAKSSTTAL